MEALQDFLPHTFYSRQEFRIFWLKRTEFAAVLPAVRLQKITLQHGLIYSKLLHGFGMEHTQKYLQANKQAMEKYEELCKKY